MSKNRKRRATNYARLRELLTRPPANTQTPATPDAAPKLNPYARLLQRIDENNGRISAAERNTGKVRQP